MERDFYFGKLRDAEILLQSYTGPDRATVDALFKSEAPPQGLPFLAVLPSDPSPSCAVLYATDDDFVAEGDDGAAAR